LNFEPFRHRMIVGPTANLCVFCNASADHLLLLVTLSFLRGTVSLGVVA
jgi:hypothetical protein